MSEVFILGAGFSKAISNEMPLLNELSSKVAERFKPKHHLSDEVQAMLQEDFEKALTFLASENPWLPESENLRNRALYLELTHLIRTILDEACMSQAVWGTKNAPPWLEALITYWHQNKCSVISLNYDTLVERVASGTWRTRDKIIHTEDLYPIDLIAAGKRAAMFVGGESMDTFRLFKLHGSINWFYSGRSNFYGESLYFVPCTGGVDSLFMSSRDHHPERIHWEHTIDKVALIIPPILDKSAFFQHESLRSMWVQAGQAIKQANKIVCMGYSLPAGDLTMAQFIRNSAPDNRVPFEIVDISLKPEHFSSIIGGDRYEFQQSSIDKNCISQFVLQHCVPNESD